MIELMKLLLLIIKAAMEKQRRSNRYANSCALIPNPFKPSAQNAAMQTLIPKSILSKISRTPTISCETVINLPPLHEQTQLQECLRACSIASHYQTSLPDAPHSFVEKPAEICHSTPTRETIPNGSMANGTPGNAMRAEEFMLWNDDAFLSRLNQYIRQQAMESNSGMGFSCEDLFEK